MVLDRILNSGFVQFFCHLVESIQSKIASIWKKKPEPMPTPSPHLFSSSLIDRDVRDLASTYLDRTDEDGKTRLQKVFESTALKLKYYYPNSDPLTHFTDNEAFYRSELIKRDRLWFTTALIGDIGFVDMQNVQNYLLAAALLEIVRNQIQSAMKSLQTNPKFVAKFIPSSVGG